MGGSRVFVDTNVLVYSTVRNCPGFHKARAWLDRMLKRGDSLVITPQIIREYLVVLTRGKIFTETFTIDQVLREVEAILKTVSVLDETVQANLVAVMLTYGVQRLATYNIADLAIYRDHHRANAVSGTLALRRVDADTQPDERVGVRRRGLVHAAATGVGSRGNHRGIAHTLQDLVGQAFVPAPISLKANCLGR